MYTKYYGLIRKPFDLRPDPDVVFMSEAHQEALSMLRYGVREGKGFILLTGDVGTGKTTLLQTLLKSLPDKTNLCHVANPLLSVNDFYYYLAHAYGLGEFDGNKAKFLFRFADYLRDRQDRGERVVLIVDEAQTVSLEMFEEIRLLSNQDIGEYGILSILLVGQPELNKLLCHNRLLPLRQRISIRFQLSPFSPEETEQYIKYRLRKAGAQRLDLFSVEAVRLIYLASKGFPRLINILCDHALLSGYAEERPRLEAKAIRECVNDLHIPGENAALPVPEKGKWLRVPESLPGRAGLAILVFVLFVLAVWLGIQLVGPALLGPVLKGGRGSFLGGQEGVLGKFFTFFW